jgi:hypothetical protein
MLETASDVRSAGTRFPFINLEKAIGRARQLFDADQKGREMPIISAFEVWGYSLKSSGGHQTIAALKIYGLIKKSSSDSRKIGLTDLALRYFRDEREEEKQKVARHFALAPKLMAALWADWHTTPPADTIARSHLKAERGLNDHGARTLLAIYKENLVFAGLKADDKPIDPVEGDHDDELVEGGGIEIPPSNPARREAKLMDGERELTTGLLSKDAKFRLIVSGPVGVKEIERLIRKLELDKEILAEQEDDESAI